MELFYVKGIAFHHVMDIANFYFVNCVFEIGPTREHSVPLPFSVPARTRHVSVAILN